LRAEVVAGHVREVRKRLGVAVRPVVEEAGKVKALQGDLLLEQGVKYDRRRPGLLHPQEGVQVLTQRRRRAHQRVTQRQPQVVGRQVDHAFVSFPPPTAPSAAGNAARCSYSRQRSRTSSWARRSRSLAVAGSAWESMV